MKKILISCFLIMIIVSFYQINITYSKYKNVLTDTYNNDKIGIWSITLNGTDISQGSSTYSITLGDTEYGVVEDSNSKEGTIAPEKEIYFDIKINPANTDVAVLYIIDVGDISYYVSGGTSSVTSVVNISRVEEWWTKDGDSDITVSDSSLYYLNTTDNKYIGIIPINKINGEYQNKIRVYLKWSSGDDSIDTSIGEIENAILNAPITITCKQYLGETLSSI